MSISPIGTCLLQELQNTLDIPVVQKVADLGPFSLRIEYTLILHQDQVLGYVGLGQGETLPYILDTFVFVLEIHENPKPCRVPHDFQKFRSCFKIHKCFPKQAF